MSSSDSSSSRQSPSPGGPTPSGSPLSALPASRSSELKCAVAPPARVSTTGPARMPPSSVAATVASPASAEWLITRTNPWRTMSDALGNSPATATSPVDPDPGCDQAPSPSSFVARTCTSYSVFSASPAIVAPSAVIVVVVTSVHEPRGDATRWR